MATEDRGYTLGTLATLGIAGVAGLLIKMLGSILLGSIAGSLLSLIVIAVSILYFGTGGLRTIPVGYKGISLLFGKRVAGSIHPEGIIWTWPKPIGDVIAVDGRIKALPLPMTTILSQDSVPIDIEVVLQTQITNIDTYFNTDEAEKSLRDMALSEIRSIVFTLPSVQVNQKRADITRALITRLSTSQDTWGITVSHVQILTVRLPHILESAFINVQVEESRQDREIAQAKGEMIEAKHVAEMMTLYKSAGLSPTEAMNMLQSERGKATRIILDGAADPLVKAGALAGGILGKSQTTGGNTDPKSQRRRNNN